MKLPDRVVAALRLAGACAVTACIGCSSGSGGGSTSSNQGTLIPACTIPAGAATNSCKARTMFEICQVPSGSVVNADGSVTTPDGTSAKCQDACSPTEYSLSCSSSAVASDALGCRLLPLPTPQGVSEYCCPCGG